MRSYEERAKDFIKVFSPYCKGCKSRYDFEKAAYKFMSDHPNRKIRVEYGVSRVAFIISDYVIKVDYRHNDYKWAGNCASEYNSYLRFQKDGFDYLVAACSRYRCQNRYFYIMPKVNGIGNQNRDFWKALNGKEEDYILLHCLDLHSGNYGWSRKTGKPVIIDYAATEF